MQEIDNGEMLRRLATGAMYLDVRTPEEFDAGHAPGAYNVPLLLRDSDGSLLSNPEFLTIATALLEGASAPVVACQAGGRSRKACALLEAAGQKDLFHFAGGYGGSRDPFGARVPGFVDSGSPIATKAEPGRSYLELRARFGDSPRTPGPPGPR